MAILEVNNLHKQLGGIQVSRGINLSVEKNQIHAIIGPNGAGKTTLIAQISGALKPDRGSILLNNTDITRMPEHQRAQAGLVRSFQITSIIPTMSLLENVMLAIQSPGARVFHCWKPMMQNRSRNQAIEMLEAVGLGSQVEQMADQIAHGEQRLLELSMVLALKPKLLLLDEPMAGMSKSESKNLLSIFQQLKGRSSILLIEHDMDAVFALADTTSVLVNGHIIATDTSAAIRNNVAVQKAYLGESS